MSTPELSPVQSANTESASGCQQTGCCTTTEAGSAACVVPDARQSDTLQASNNPYGFGLQVISEPLRTDDAIIKPPESRWKQIRGGVMFAVACITSPCCTPLIVPVVLSLLAGTPAALWLGQNLGWVFGGLTLISVVSLILGLRWMNGPQGRITITRRSNQRLNSSVSSNL